MREVGWLLPLESPSVLVGLRCSNHPLLTLRSVDIEGGRLVGEEITVMVMTTVVKEGFLEEGTPGGASLEGCVGGGGTHGLCRSCCCCCR